MHFNFIIMTLMASRIKIVYPRILTFAVVRIPTLACTIWGPTLADFRWDYQCTCTYMYFLISLGSCRVFGSHPQLEVVHSIAWCIYMQQAWSAVFNGIMRVTGSLMWTPLMSRHGWQYYCSQPSIWATFSLLLCKA